MRSDATQFELRCWWLATGELLLQSASASCEPEGKRSEADLIGTELRALSFLGVTSSVSSSN